MSQPPPIILTPAQLQALPEYSCSRPTGTTIGKRWRRNNNAYRPPVRVEVLGVEFVIPWPPEWWLGEYAEHPDPKLVNLIWRPILVLKETGKIDVESSKTLEGM